MKRWYPVLLGFFTLVIVVGIFVPPVSLVQRASVMRKYQKQIELAEKDMKELIAKLAQRDEEVAALTTPRHTEALRLVRSWREVCKRIQLGKLMGDEGCQAAINASQLREAWPSRKIVLEIFRDPEKAIKMATGFIIDRCKLVEGELPKVCVDAEDHQPNAVTPRAGVPH